MGFRNGAYCTVWDIESKSDNFTRARISISRRDKQTGEYVTDFSGYVGFPGTANAAKALALNKGSRIKLGDVDVSSKYIKEKNVTYYNFTVWSFEPTGYIKTGLSGNGVTGDTSFDPDAFINVDSSYDGGDDLPF